MSSNHLRKLVATVVALTMLCLGSEAWAAPDTTSEPLHIRSESDLTTTQGTKLHLPAGYFLPDPVYDILDLEVHRLQDSETRLNAENKSLRQSADRPGAGLKTTLLLVGISLVAGMGLAWYAF